MTASFSSNYRWMSGHIPMLLPGTLTATTDNDNDGAADAEDNCLNQSNANRTDLDADGLGNVCDWDADGDDLTTQQESAVGTNPLDSDSDNDGISDGDKVNGGRNPLVNRRMGHSPNPDHPVGRLASG